MISTEIRLGNLLGGPRAEIDNKMLEIAFIETADFRALTNTRDFNFVVGRRGTGKSALYMKVSEFLIKNKIGYVYCKTPTEYESLELLSTIRNISKEYRAIRSITRVAWRVSLLMALLKDICSHYRFSKCESAGFLSDYVVRHKSLLEYDCFKKTTEIVKHALSASSDILEVPGVIAKRFAVEDLHKSVNEALSTLNKIAYFLFDALDEGWCPEQTSTAILGGLAASASDFSDRQSGIQIVLFVRDNIFRSLSFFDRDFSRHIEGNTLRLRWDVSSLLHLIANRLRTSLNLYDVESDIKVWNLFAQKDLKNRDGFVTCLNFTLYRPRDLLVLLNEAFLTASRSGRNVIVKDDIESTSKQISQNRIEDLLKEYDTVFPSLPLFVDVFKEKPAFQTYGTIVDLLDGKILNNSFERKEASDFAVLGSGKQAFFALYSVGFIGLENDSSGKLQFCHDGSLANIDATYTDQRACIHPCYWKALDIQSETIDEKVLIEIYDDATPPEHKEFQDIRTKMIGQLVSQLPVMPEGKENASKFEEWAFRTIQILFAGQLTNPELKPDQDSVQRRDIVVTNMANSGFWRRVREDYSSRQVVFEVKNYSSLRPDDFRQALSYSCDSYGRFIIIVNRNENEGVSETDRGWIKEMWDKHQVLIFLLPAIILSRCVGKLRSGKRFDYADDQLNKRLDTFLRSYLSLRHITKKYYKSRKGLRE